MQGCLACATASGQTPIAGGLLFSGAHWRVRHAAGVVPLGTLALITARHCFSVADLTADEASELGPLLRTACTCVMGLTEGDEAHVEVWSHAQFVPGHLHFVVRPASAGSPHASTYEPDVQAIEGFATRARGYFSS